VPPRSDEDVRRAVEERLAQRSRETGQPLVRIRKRLVFERCLARLQRRKDSPWILRGGFALELGLGSSSARTAKTSISACKGASNTPHGRESMWLRRCATS